MEINIYIRTYDICSVASISPALLTLKINRITAARWGEFPRTRKPVKTARYRLSQIHTQVHTESPFIHLRNTLTQLDFSLFFKSHTLQTILEGPLISCILQQTGSHHAPPALQLSACQDDDDDTSACIQIFN